MRRKASFFMMVVPLLLLLTAVVSAQTGTSTPQAVEINPDANVSWPPAVYVLRGRVDVRGTANVAGQQNYFLEFRPLNEDLTSQEAAAPWFPAVLPSTTPVIDDVLGTWDTSVAPDGLYELRLTINVQGSTPLFVRVAPLRVENNPPPFLVTPTPQASATPTATIQSNQPLPPTPTALSSSPSATALTNANVRAGDSTAYDVVGSLQAGQTVPVVGISSSGSGWYQIELPNGRRGFVAPSTVQVSGNVALVPRVAPPATPTPPATATPILPDIAFIGLRYDRGTIRQGESFQVIATLRNDGGQNSPAGILLCTVRPQNVEVNFLVDTIAPGQQREVSQAVRLDSGGGGDVRWECAFDPNNTITEIRRDNNFFTLVTPLAAP